MAGDLGDLADRMDILAGRIPVAASEVKKQAARAILDDLLAVTPVDVGEAVSNWQVSLEEPVLDSIPAWEPSPKGRYVKGHWTHSVPPEATRQANAPLARAAAEAFIDMAEPGMPILISNNAPHIRSLDRGHSQQAPAGFVDRAIAIGRSIIDNAKVLV